MLNEEFWTERYKTKDMGWDLGRPSGPLAAYIQQLNDKEKKILIPGAGNAYEAEMLWKEGFRNVHVLDISTMPLEQFKARNPDFPDDQLHHEDFFMHKGQYDLILEQTFFCALDPSLRDKYVAKMHELLNDSGHIAGVLFRTEFNKPGPPFGGTASEYQDRFSNLFTIIKMEPCYNSIEPRSGNELFILLEKRLISHE